MTGIAFGYRQPIHPDFQKFSDWAIQADYIKTPLIEKKA
jgi:hypothetical protein